MVKPSTGWIVVSSSMPFTSASPALTGSAQGGAVTPATVLEPKKHTTHRWPWFLPDGKHFLFLANSHTGGDAKQNGVYFASVDGRESRLVLATE